MSESVDDTLGGAPRLGAMFGRYRIDSVIGRGGMGMVFRATDTELDRAVALKFLAPEMSADQATRDRFMRESRLAAAIEHPHIVTAYDAGIVSGTLFIAMRYVPGEDLAHALRREAPLDRARVLTIGGQVADALDAAHERGLIHRDVKPANILLEDRGEEWAWLSDFGLTRRIDGSALSVGDGLAGSIDYMAPEAIEHGTVDGRADQYSLGCLIYHCVTGALPFEGATEASVLYAHVHHEPPRLTGIDGVAGGVLDAALQRALAKRPEDQFPDCRSFVAAARGDQPPSPASVSGSTFPTTKRADEAASSGRRGSWTAGPRRAAIAALVVVLVAGAGAAYLMAAAGQPQGPAATPGTQAGSPGTQAGSPGPSGLAPLVSADGVIVFAGDRAGNYDIWAALPDGTGLRPLTHGSVRERSPDVSPDGSTVIFAAGRIGERDLYRMNADGSGRTRLTSSSKDDFAPAFSPDGRSIAWTSDRSGDNDIWVMTDTGNGFVEAQARNATAHPAGDNNHDDLDASWFPDGQRLAFASSRTDSSDIWVVDAFRESLPEAWTLDRLPDHQPTVGPDRQIVFVAERDANAQTDVFVMPKAGGSPRRLTDSAATEALPDFSPGGDELVFQERRSAASARLVTTTAAGERARAIPIDMLNAVDPAWVARLGTE